MLCGSPHLTTEQDCMTKSGQSENVTVCHNIVVIISNYAAVGCLLLKYGFIDMVESLKRPGLS
jgi:hypothetical protein